MKIQGLIDIEVAVEAYYRAEQSGRLTQRVQAWDRLYRAFREPLGLKGMLMWLEYETWTTTS